MITVTAKVDERALAAHLKRLDKNRGKPLLYRAEKTINSASRTVLPALKANLPASGRSRRVLKSGKKQGSMRTKAGLKLLKKQGGEDIRPTWIGVKHFAFRWLTEGTQTHSLARRSDGGGFAVFPDGGVRPLASITVSGITPHDYITPVWESQQGRVIDLVRRGTFDVT